MTEQEAIDHAMEKHPECAYAKSDYGLSVLFEPTWVISLWRNEDCYLNEDPPRHVVDGIYRNRAAAPTGSEARNG